MPPFRGYKHGGGSLEKPVYSILGVHEVMPGRVQTGNNDNASATTETLRTSTMVPAIARGPTPPLSDAGSFVQVPPVELQTTNSDQASDFATAPSLTPQPPETNTSGDGASDNASAISANWQKPELL